MTEKNSSSEEHASVSPSYAGEEMLTEQSFFRRLPAMMEPEQKLRLEALVISVDTLSHSFRVMRAIATERGGSMNELTRPERNAMFASAWQIVDHIHVVRRLLESLLPGGPDATIKDFLSESKEATALRNRMDHLNQNIGNLVKRKKSFHPLFGSLAFVFAKPEIGDDGVPGFKSGFTIMLMAGTAGRGENIPFVNPAGRPFCPPVDLFQLSAFDHTLHIGSVLAKLRTTVSELEMRAEAQARTAAERFAAATGKTVEELMGHPAAGITLALAFNFSQPSVT